MDQDRYSGTARNFAGKVQEGVGRVTGDAATEAEGAMNQAAGAVQDAYGKAKDAAVVGEDYLHKFIEEQPYTATLVALGIGAVFGYLIHQQSAPSARRGYW